MPKCFNLHFVVPKGVVFLSQASSLLYVYMVFIQTSCRNTFVDSESTSSCIAVFVERITAELLRSLLITGYVLVFHSFVVMRFACKYHVYIQNTKMPGFMLISSNLFGFDIFIFQLRLYLHFSFVGHHFMHNVWLHSTITNKLILQYTPLPHMFRVYYTIYQHA